MSNKYVFEPDYVIPPGETLLELLEYNDMTQNELATRLGISKKTVNEIIKGKAPISYGTAEKLEFVFGVDASFWNNLEKNYREQLAESEKKKLLETQIGEIKKFPMTELLKHKWIELEDKSPAEKVDKLLKFFGVTSFDNMKKIFDESKILEGAFRISTVHKIDEKSLICWIRKGEIEASKINTEPFSKKLAREKVMELRSLVLETDPEIFIPQLQNICASFGVAVVFVPELRNSRVSGLTRWLSPKPKAVIQLSLRYKRHDSMWFTFFHELGHVLLHEKKPFIEMRDYQDSQMEIEADNFASNVLIPEIEYSKFLSEGTFNKQSIIRFARKIKTHPGIVLGRLQNERIIPWSYFNDLKISYQWET